MRTPSAAALPAEIPQAAAAALCGLLLALLVARLPALVVIGVLAVAASAVLFLQRPDLGLLAALVARSATDLSYTVMGGAAVHPALGSLPNIALVLILIGVGGVFLVARNVPVLRLPAGAPFALLLLAGFIGMLRSANALRSFSEWLPVVSGLVAYALAARLFRTPRQTRAVVVALGLSFVLPALLGFQQLLTGGGLIDPHVGPRVMGSFVHPNAFGVYLVVIFSVFLAEAVVHAGRRRLVALLIVGATLPLFVGTLTRVAWVGALVALLVAGLLRSRLLLVLLPVGLLLAVAAVPTIGARLADPLGGSFADRTDIWRGLVAQWVATTASDAGPIGTAVSRLTGLGPGVVDDLTAPWRGGFGYAAHNDYLRVLVEYGLFGLAAFLTMHAVLLVFAWRTWRRARHGPLAAPALAFVALAVAYPIMSLTENVFAATQNQLYFWTVAGLAVAASRAASAAGEPADDPRAPAAPA